MLAFPLRAPAMFLSIGLVEALSSLLGFLGAANLPGAREVLGRCWGGAGEVLAATDLGAVVQPACLLDVGLLCGSMWVRSSAADWLLIEMCCTVCPPWRLQAWCCRCWRRPSCCGRCCWR